MSFMRNMVRIVEVGPRDGLQNISTHVPTAIKRELIQRLISARFRTVEVTSIVSPKAIPQLADHEKILTDPLLKSHFQRPDIRLPVLVPNIKGFKRALDLGVKEIAVFISASEGFSKANINCTVEQGISRATELAGHFHDTYGQALANAWEAYRCGIRVFDSSVAGLGGCPFAPGARGNLASEDLVYMFENSGVPTGVDLDRLADIGEWISQQLKLPNWSRAGAALLTKKRFSSQNRAKDQGSAIGSFQWKEESNTEGLIIMRDTMTVKLILDRPKNGNALTASMISQLTQFFESCKNDTSISRIILTANGKFFCTGMDLSKESSPVSKGGNATTDQFALLTNLFQSIDDAPQVTIASINGPCFGGGVGLALACDIRIAAPMRASR
ncbi:unnamed protein product [Parascedosporium putredinis]|uniref:hydroxymethylglutaryl-CoA lyase n=1 Tax=Parascedosporium putredinis TaxID=1442378 RepID=A0A9P1HBM9_9PEZI|nr:unnamed protein product [Parascedosporium putredinis]CAI8005059.1 unnamed protein product [Parascedosporium putredinis]